MTKLFIKFCSAQDGESTDMNCFVFWAHCKNGKILSKRQVYNKGIFTNFGYFFIIWNNDIIKLCSWFRVKWCNLFCCIMFECQVIHTYNHKPFDKGFKVFLFTCTLITWYHMYNTAIILLVIKGYTHQQQTPMSQVQTSISWCARCVSQATPCHTADSCTLPQVCMAYDASYDKASYMF